MSDHSEIVGINIRREANSRSARLGLLPRGARIEVGERSPDRKWARIASVIEGAIVPVRPGEQVDPAALTGWLYLGELEADTSSEPAILDAVVVLTRPRPIQAGALVGHLGEYQRFEDARPVPERGTRPLLHLEVFSGEDVPAFVERCRSYAQSLPETSRTLLVVETGAKLVQPRAPDVMLAAGQRVAPTTASTAVGRWVKVRRSEVKIADRSTLGSYKSATNTYYNGAVWTGWFVGASDDQRTRSEAEATRRGYRRREVVMPSRQELWVERGALGESGAVPEGGLPGWSTFPLQVANASGPEVGYILVLSRAELEGLGADDRAVDPEGTRWWRLNAGPGGEDAAGRGGWACEKGHARVSWQSPWAWPGFEFVAEGEVRPADLLSRTYLRSEVALAHEQGDFKARADKVEGSALITKVYEQIDQNKDGNLDAQELRAAMQQPLLARSLARIIAHYESEWGGEMAKWDELDPLMLDGLPEWQVEKQRIDALRWWPQVFPADPTVHHIHPIALIANFIGARGGGCPNCEVEITAAQLKTIFPGASDERIGEVMAVFNAAYTKFDVLTCRRKAHFFAQVREEVGDSVKALAESLNYSPEGLKGTFRYFRNHPAEATQFGRTTAHSADQQAIANRAYGNRNGNGNIASGDGWRFRGKGYLQLTGRSNYQAVQNEINRQYPDSGVDIMGSGDVILTPRGGMVSAMGFWRMNKLNELADRGETDEHVNAITAIVNLHTKSYSARRENFAVTKQVFKVSECTSGQQNPAAS